MISTGSGLYLYEIFCEQLKKLKLYIYFLAYLDYTVLTVRLPKSTALILKIY